MHHKNLIVLIGPTIKIQTTRGFVILISLRLRFLLIVDSSPLGRGHGLCNWVTPPDELLCSLYVCTARDEEKQPMRINKSLGRIRAFPASEICYDYPDKVFRVSIL